jgi:TorA maturation chaperone TorD
MTSSISPDALAGPVDDTVNLAHLRRETYRLLAAALLYPDESSIESMPVVAARLRRSSHLAAKMAFFGPWEQFIAVTESLGLADLPALEQTYLALFVGTTVRRPVPLHETSYLDPAAELSGHVLADIEGAYAATGIAASPSTGEMSDHAAVELEFVSYLIGEEESGWEANEVSQVLRSVRIQRRFLHRHPCVWLPALARGVASRNPGGLYAAATSAAWAIAVHDVDFLSALGDAVRAANRET